MSQDECVVELPILVAPQTLFLPLQLGTPVPSLAGRLIHWILPPAAQLAVGAVDSPSAAAAEIMIRS
jgi:hypothetical protein